MPKRTALPRAVHRAAKSPKNRLQFGGLKTEFKAAFTQIAEEEAEDRQAAPLLCLQVWKLCEPLKNLWLECNNPINSFIFSHQWD